MRRALTAREKLDKHSAKDEASGCVLWTAAKSRKGYGHVRHDGKAWRAHRLAYETFVGPIPQGMCVCHHCDTPSCVNVEHLFLGSYADNIRDRDCKGRVARGDANGARTQPHRLARGERCHSAKLTAGAVREIRALLSDGFQQQAIAERFRISQQEVSRIRTGKIWRHVW